MSVRNAQDAFASKKWGIFTHYIDRLQNNPDMPQSRGISTSWDECTAALDVGNIARTLHDVGAGYYFFTVMQGTRYLAAPNETFRKITQTEPYSKRDLVSELYEKLHKYGIDLCLYYTGDGPYKSEPEGSRFGFSEPRGHVSDEFVDKWSSVLREYAVRYGDKVTAWWIDGCYTKFLGYNESQLVKYIEACRDGNPDVLVALNSGNDIIRGDGGSGSEESEAINDSILLPEQTMICGEENEFTYVPRSRFLGKWKNAQAHFLAPLGTASCGIGASWASDGVQCSKEQLAEYIKHVNDVGGVVSIDVILYRDGSFSEKQLEVLDYIGKTCR